MQGLIFFYPGHQDLHFRLTICDNNEVRAFISSLILRMCTCDDGGRKTAPTAWCHVLCSKRCVSICHARGFKTGFFYLFLSLCAAITFNSASQSVTSATGGKLKHLRELLDLFLLQQQQR